MKRVGLVLILVCMLILGFILTPSLSESPHITEERVSSPRATLIVGSDQAYTTIGTAITAANPGDTVRVYAGTYNEQVTISKTLSLIGNGSAVTIIDSLGSNGPVEITADWCNITGFTMKGSSSGATDAGIHIDADFNHVWNCNCSDNQGNGIRIDGMGNNTVENCLVTNNNRNGIRIQTSSYNIIRGCNIKYNQENGIHLQNTQGNLIENNTISDSLGASQSSISISSVNDNIIRFNHLSNDEHGLAVAMGDNNVIIGNTIVNSSNYAIDLGGACNLNTIYHNNIIDCNTPGVQASDGGSGNTWHNGYPSGGNYWSDWTSPDVNTSATQDQPGSDGIVDNPYILDGGPNKNDSYPLANPFIILNIITSDVITATEDILYSVTYDAWTNMHGSTLTWSLNTDAVWLTRTGSTISGTPDNSHVGSYWVDVSVSIGVSQDSHNFTLTVQNVNDPPEIITTDVLTTNETELYSVDYEANDIDPTGDTLTWDVETNATFLSMNSGTGVLEGTPSRDELGSYFVNVSVNDGNTGGLDFSNFTLDVLNINDPPVINTTDVLTANETQLYSVDYEAIDIDPTNDILTWGVETNATFLAMESDTGVLSGTPSRDALGKYFVNVTVNDGNGGWDNSNFTLTVLEINEVPGINRSWADFSFDEDTIDESISLNDWFVDYDGDELIFSYSGNDKLSVTILNTSVVRLTPEANWSGNEVLTFYANDSVFQGSDSVTVTVVPVNDAPFNAEIELLVTNPTEGGNQTVKGNASDVDIPYGDVLIYNWSSNVSGFIGLGKEINLSLEAGHYNIILNVTDSAGAWVVTTKNIQILPIKDDVDINTTDTDGDNLPDDWEVYHFSNLSQGKDDDPDNDTFTNFQEWENNTDPNDPNDYPGKTDDKQEEEDDDDGDDSSFISDYSWLIILLFLIIILLIIFAFIYSRRKKEEEEELVEGERFECPDCGASLGESETVCPACGVEFEGEEERFECPDCGTTVEAGESVCPACGAEFEEEEEFEADELTEESELPEGEEHMEGATEEAGEEDEFFGEEELVTEDELIDEGEPVFEEEPFEEELVGDEDEMIDDAKESSEDDSKNEFQKE